jgi:tetratricopeptide (TPR) repeat protein
MGKPDALDYAARASVAGGNSHTVQRIQAQIAGQGPSAELYSELGIARYRNHQPDRSLDAFSAMLKFRKPNAGELRFIALDYVALGDLASAEKSLLASLKLKPTDWRTWQYLGGVQYSQDKAAEAAVSFEECLKEGPHNALAEDGLARSLEGEGKFKEASLHYQRAIKFNQQEATPSSFPSLHYGEFLLRQNDLNNALRELMHSERLAPKDAETHEFLSKVHQEMNAREEAISEMRIASSLRPESPRLHFLLGQLYREAKKRIEAQEEFRQYEELSRKDKGGSDR